MFGHFGDKLGRKKLLIVSLLMMGVATFAIGLLPSHAQVGVLAPVLLTVLRCIQGFALGGEWGGAVLIVSEHGSPRNRGFWASWPQAGAPAGQLIANGLLAFLAVFQSDEASSPGAGGSRSCCPPCWCIVGLWVRLQVEESPIFRQATERADARAAAGVIDKMPVAARAAHLPARDPHRDGRPDGRERQLLHLHHRHHDVRHRPSSSWTSPSR